MKKIFTYILLLTMALVLPGISFAQLNSADSDIYSKDLDKLAESIFISFELLEEGRSLYNAGDIEKARTKFEKALKEDPNNDKAKEYLKLCSPQNTLNTGSAKTLDKTKPGTDISRTIDLLSQKIKEAKRLKTSSGSITKNEYQELTLDRKIKKAEVFLDRGDSFFSKNQYEEAYHLYKKAAEILQSIG